MEYLLKASIVIAIFYGCYKLFLQRDTFFESNRWFLLLGLITAFALPFVVIPVYIEYTPMPIQNFVINSTTPAPVEITETPIDIWQYVFMVYAIGVGLFFIRFCVQLCALALLIFKNKKYKKNGYTFVETTNSTPPFSFFRWMVYNPKQFSETELQHIITHEKIHVKQYHSIDIILSQLASIIFWFNPITWFYKKDLQQNLEFIADYKAQYATSCKKSYQELLLKTSVPDLNVALTNNFYSSLIKKRIVMLHKSKSKKRNLFKYAFVLPFLAIFLMSFNTEEVYVARVVESVNSAEINPNKAPQKTFVITKNFTDNDLQNLKLKLDLQNISATFTNIKRNNANEITKLTIKLDNGKGSGGATWENENKPIPNIEVGENKNGRVIARTVLNSDDKNDPIGSLLKKHGAESLLDYTKKDDKASSTNNKPFIKKSIIKISGTVTNTEGLGLPGANIIIKGTTTGTTTDFDGNYTIKASKGDMLVFSYKGMVTQKIKVTKNKIGVVLVPSKNQVAGQSNNNKIYFIDGKETPEKEFKKIFAPNFETIIVLNSKDAIKKYGDRAKNGAVEAITKKNSGSDLLKIVQGNVAKNNERPLIHLDGEEVSVNVLKSLDPDKIKYVNIIKDTKAVTIYGQKAKNGFVEIITKKNNDWKTGFKVGKPLNSVNDLPQKPLIIIDGKEEKNKTIDDLDADNIYSINVIKAENAIKQYGDKGKDGVILVKTKNKHKEFVASGKVTNNEGLGLHGANIIIKGTSNGCSTGYNGNYSINVSKGDKLVFSFIGMTSKEIEVKNKNNINVILKSKPGSGLAIDAMSSKKPIHYQNGRKISQKEFKRILHDSLKKAKVNNKVSKTSQPVVSGIITDKKGKPIQGAMVLNGETIGVMTNAKGEYRIEAKKGDTLVYSSKNMDSQEIEVKEQKSIDVKLTKKKN